MVAGHIHHGKTALMDMLVFETHQLTWDVDQPVSLNLFILIYRLILYSRSDTQIRTFSPVLEASP